MKTINLRRFATILFLSLLAIPACAQVPNSATERNGKLVFVEYEDMPKFPGGDEAIKKIVKKNIRIPEKVAKAGVRGNLFITFIVMKKGFIDLEKDHVRYYNRLKDKSGNPCNDSTLIKLCEDEAYRILTWIPRWIPGKQNGEPIDVKISLPIVFGN